MNINSNELFLLKKIKFAAGENNEGTQNVNSVVVNPSQDGIQTGLNALMFKGMTNVINDPELATATGYMKNIELPETEEKDGEEYIAPYKSNIAFQGKFAAPKNIGNSVKTWAKALVIGAAALGSTTAMTSCEQDKEIEYVPTPAPGSTVIVNINIDMAQFAAWFSLLDQRLQQMYEEQKITNQQLEEQKKANEAFYNQMIALMIAQGNKAEEFYKQFGEFMTNNELNWDLTISMLTGFGVSLDDAVGLLNDIKQCLVSGDLEGLKNKIDTIISKLTSIENMFAQYMANFDKYAQQMLDKQDELIYITNNGFDELIRQGYMNQATMRILITQNQQLIDINKKQLENDKAILDAINKVDLDMNANFDTVVATLNINKDELINMLIKMGCRYEDILKMTTADIIKAIEKNTAATKATNEMISRMTKYLTEILPKLLKENKITNDQLRQLKNDFNNFVNNANAFMGSAEEFFNQAITLLLGSYELNLESNINQQAILEELKAQGKTEAEAKNILKQMLAEAKKANKSAEERYNAIMELLGHIDGTVTEISNDLKSLINMFQEYMQKEDEYRKAEYRFWQQSLKNDRFQTSILLDMKKNQENIARNVQNIKVNVGSLKSFVENHYDEFIAILQGSGTSDISKADLEAMLKQLGITITQAIRMSKTDLIKAIKDFENTFVKVEEQHSEQYATIIDKLNDISLGQTIDNDAVINAIKNVTNAINQGKDDITAELKALEAALDQIQKTLNKIYSDLGKLSYNANYYFGKWDATFTSALGSLANIEKELKNIKSEVKSANAFLKSMDDEIKKLRAKIDELKSIAGNDIDYDKLEEMWQKHDDANFEKYSKLIKSLGIDPSKFDSIEDLLKAIDAKMEYIKENTDLLQQILNKLDGLDLTNQQLAEIKELLKNFKCNCECGKSNEGVLGDLDNILG